MNVRGKMPEVFVVRDMRGLKTVLKNMSDMRVLGVEVH